MLIDPQKNKHINSKGAFFWVHRGYREGKSVHAHVVGLGLGVWQEVDEQPEYFVEVVMSIIDHFDLPWIGCIDFSWFPEECPKKFGGERQIHKTKHGNDTDELSGQT